MLDLEYCDICDKPTGNAGRLDDSIVCEICDKVICTDCQAKNCDDSVLCIPCSKIELKKLLHKLQQLEKDYTNIIYKIEELRTIVWEHDIPHPTIPEYVEHHAGIQTILRFIDRELLKEVD